MTNPTTGLDVPEKPTNDDGTPMKPQGPTHFDSEPLVATDTGGPHTDGPTHFDEPKP
jgi:hypothetical protein